MPLVFACAVMFFKCVSIAEELPSNAEADVLQEMETRTNVEADVLSEMDAQSEENAQIDPPLFDDIEEEEKSVLIVGDDQSDFTTIGEAVDFAKEYCSKSNRVSIEILPGIYREEITLWDNPGIDFKGSGVGRTIIEADAVYPSAPLSASGTMSVSGITFRLLSGNSYAFHFEAVYTPNLSGVTEFSNCAFISETNNSAVGAGLGGNSGLVFRNCTFETEKGAAFPIYFHNSPLEHSKNQSIGFYDCEIKGTDSNNICIRIDDSATLYNSTDSTMDITFQNVMAASGKILYRNFEKPALDYIPENDRNFAITEDSIGNSANLWGVSHEKKIWSSYPDGKLRYYEYGKPFTNQFKSDGIYTYYLQTDGAAMTNRLTYHPDGVHLIYFDEDGHELFDRFKYCQDVKYTCYFDTMGYLYKDVITFQKGKPYYLDGNGKMKQSEWFRFDNELDYGYAEWDGSLRSSGFSNDPQGRTVFYHWNGMVARGLITDGVWYYLMDETDGHYIGKFQQ